VRESDEGLSGHGLEPPATDGVAMTRGDDFDCKRRDFTTQWRVQEQDSAQARERCRLNSPLTRSAALIYL